MVLNVQEKMSNNWSCGERAGPRLTLTPARWEQALDRSCSEGRIGNRQDLDLGPANRKSFSRGQFPFLAKFNSLLSEPTK